MDSGSTATGTHDCTKPLYRSRFLGRLAKFAAGVLALAAAAASATAAASLVTPQQLTVTAANAQGGSIYNLNLTPNARGTGALISGLQALNTDGARHGLVDALVWVPNAFTGTLDLVVADLTKGQILRYAGPTYGTASVIFAHTTRGSGPSNPVGLAADASGNLLVVSPSNPLDATPGLWIIPFDKTTGTYSAPVLIDHTFSGVRTLALAEVVVASTPATAAGTAAPAWNAGDVLVLVGDTFNSRVVVYSKTAIAGVLAKPTVPLSGPTSTAVTSRQFLNLIAAPFGMDVWPADAAHGVSLLFTTIDGRIIRFDTKTSAFTTNFANGLGFGLQKIKVGSFAGTPYAFAAQLGSTGEIFQFGAPPASGANKPLAVINKGVNAPVGIALTTSGSTPASACVAPQSCSPLGPNVSIQISGPGAANIPPGATILEQSCTVPADPRVAVVNGTWSCLGSTINVCGATPTPGCVPATLDVANYCPGFPSTILPASMCGHSGPTGSAFAVIKATASLIDQHANDIYIQTSVDATAALPGAYDLPCQSAVGQYGPLLAFAPRSDLPTIEGSIVEDQNAPYFIDFTGLCDRSGGNTHVESMFAYGLGLNTAASGLGAGANGGLYGFVTTKFNNLSTTIANASAQITPQTVTTTLENYVTQSQNYFNGDYANDVNGYSCALNSIASADVYLRNQAAGNAFSYTAPAAGNNNPNPAGNFDARLANLFLTISGDFVFTPNLAWPTTAVPPCVVLTSSATTVGKGGSATLTFGPPTPQFTNTPLLAVPAQCTLSASDGSFTTPVTVGMSGSVSTGPLTKTGTYTASLDCAGSGGDTAISLATQTITVTAQPTLTSIAVTPANATITSGQSGGFTATGSYSDGTTQPLTGSVTWISSNTHVASISAVGVARCLNDGTTSISATSGSVTGGTPLTCQTPTPVLQTLAISPNTTQAVNEGQTQQFKVTGGYSNGSTQDLTQSAAWSSTTPAIATVGNGAQGGLVTGIAPGVTTIIATVTGVSPANVTVSVNTPTATLSANPTTAAVNSSATLTWSSANLPANAVCSLSSNSTDAPLNNPNAGTAGTLQTTDATPQTVTYTLSCTGASPVIAGVSYVIPVKYQYTGQPFTFAYAPYTTNQHVNMTLTLLTALPPNMSPADITGLPGYSLTGTDTVNNFTTTQPGSTSGAIVATDGNGNITSFYSLTLQYNPGAQQTGVSIQNDANGGFEGGYGTEDIAFTGQQLCSATCGGNSNLPGTWVIVP